MEIKIADKEYTLNFGVRFVREIDKVAGVNQSGINFGLGLTKTLPALKGYDTAALADVIYCATFPNKKRPTLVDVEAFLDDENTDLDKLFSEITEAMLASNATKLAAKNMKA